MEINAGAANQQQTEQDTDGQCNEQATAFRQGRKYHVIGWIGQRGCGVAAEQIGIEQCFPGL